MQVHEIRRSELDGAYALLAENGWAKRIGTTEDFSKLIENSQRTAVAVVGVQVVGFARGITDGLSNGYLSMVVVSPAHRSQGIGRALVQHIIGGNQGVTWVLRAGREGASEFFAKLGFSVSSVAMERTRGQTDA
jgi:ribosomal protein S18 acetylase RimI-like enzyme